MLPTPGEFKECSLLCRDSAQEMVRQRRRVLRFDLSGRGFSTYGIQDEMPNTEKFFAGQLAELLFALGETEKIDLVGFSMGGLVAAHFGATYPDKLHSLVLIAPVGTRYDPVTWWMPWFLAVAPIGLPMHLARKMTSPAILATNQWWESPPYNPDESMHWAEHHKRDAQRSFLEPALPYALLSTWQHFPFNDSEETYRLLGQHRRVPILLMWGTHDKLLDRAGAGVIQQLIPHIMVCFVDRATHSLPMERYKEVADRLSSWWGSLRLV